MSREERLAQSHIHSTTVQSEEFRTVLTKFSQLFQACCGPQGKHHMVRNYCGGHVTITGSCGRLLSAMMVTRPELKLLVSSVQAHLSRHGDGGHFLVTLCAGLILSYPDSTINPSTLTSLYKTFLTIITSYLSEPDCPVSVRADFSDLSILLQYVRSILSSKNLLNLTTSDCDHLSRLVLKTFLDSIPSEPSNLTHRVSDGVFCLTLDETPVSQSKLESGLLLRYPDIPIICGEKKLNLRKSHPSIGSSDIKSAATSCVRVCLFTCSMAGDMEEVMDSHFELSEEQNAVVEKEVTSSLMFVCDALEEEEVGLLLCQKVIHPSMKTALRSKGILYVDRLGSQVIPYVQDLTGTKPLRTIVDIPSIESSLGWVESVQHVILGDKGFLHLTKPEPVVSTLVLCASWEERLEELKMCVRAVLHGLSKLAKSKTLLMGAGCWIVHCSHMLQKKVLSELSTLAQRHHCTESMVLSALSAFRSSLHVWPHSLASHTKEDLLVDPVCYHLWRVPQGREVTPDSSNITVSCCCGSKSTSKESLPQFHWLSKTGNQPYSENISREICDVNISDADPSLNLVVDSFAMSIDALRQAVTTAGLLLSVGQFISDRN